MAILFRGRNDPDMAEAARRLVDLARGILGVGEEVTVTAAEIMCTDPGCEGLETVVMILRPGRKAQAARMKMPLRWVTEPALREALAAIETG